MKRILTLLIACLLVFSCFSVQVLADDAKNLQYELSVDGKNELVVQAGDEITVDLYLENMTDDNDYSVTNIQNEIEFDDSFFEYKSAELITATTSKLAEYSWGAKRVKLTALHTDESGKTETYGDKELIAKVTFKVKDGLSDGDFGTLVNKKSIAVDAVANIEYIASSKDMVVYIGEKPEFTLSFNTNGGSEISNEIFEANTVVDLTQYKPTKTGYTFNGWYEDESLTKKVTSITLSSDATVYAKWTKNSGGGTPPGGTTPTTPTPDDGDDIETETRKFIDVATTDWFHDAVYFVADNEYFNGVSENRFDPNGKMTRAMLVTVIGRMEKADVSTAKNVFVDVDEGTWYTGYVSWAAEKGIVNGIGESKFAPNDYVTREQMAAIFMRYASYKGLSTEVTNTEKYDSMKDTSNVSEYAVQPMKWATYHGVINGSNGSIMPKGNATRAEVAQMIKNFCNAFGI